MIREQPVQTDLLAPTWPCPICGMTGRNPDDDARPCPYCQGDRLISFDPLDFSDIPF